MITFDPVVAGLHSTSFSIKDVKTGNTVPAIQSYDGKVQWHLDLPSAAIRVLQISLSKQSSR